MIEKIFSEQLDPRAQTLVDKYKGKILIILAGGRSVWDDILNFTHGNHHTDWQYMAVNDVGMYFDGELEHWFSNHGDQLPVWDRVRQFHFPKAKHLHSLLDRQDSVVPWPTPSMGTSGLASIYCGLSMGYEQVILCGMPLDDSGHFFDPPWKKTNFSREARYEVWERARDQIFDGRVKSMSGASRDILGGP